MAEVISDRTLKAWTKRSPAGPGQRFEAIDANHPGFGVRVNEHGGIKFFALARFPRNKSTARRSIGTYGTETDRKPGFSPLRMPERRPSNGAGRRPRGKTPARKRGASSGLAIGLTPAP